MGYVFDASTISDTGYPVGSVENGVVYRGTAFHQGIGRVTDTGLVYDALSLGSVVGHVDHNGVIYRGGASSLEVAGVVTNEGFVYREMLQIHRVGRVEDASVYEAGAAALLLLLGAGETETREKVEPEPVPTYSETYSSPSGTPQRKRFKVKWYVWAAILLPVILYLADPNGFWDTISYMFIKFPGLSQLIFTILFVVFFAKPLGIRIALGEKEIGKNGILWGILGCVIAILISLIQFACFDLPPFRYIALPYFVCIGGCLILDTLIAFGLIEEGKLPNKSPIRWLIGLFGGKTDS